MSKFIKQKVNIKIFSTSASGPQAFLSLSGKSSLATRWRKLNPQIGSTNCLRTARKILSPDFRNPDFLHHVFEGDISIPEN